MEFHPADIIIMLINIIVLFFLLRLILWKYILRYMADRSRRISEEMDGAAQARQDAEAMRSEYQSKIDTIEDREREIVAQYAAKASLQSDKIIEDGKAAADRLVRDARLRIEIEKEQAVKEAQSDIVQLAASMAANILRREVSVADNRGAVDDFFDE